jgi:hypothetical protein
VRFVGIDLAWGGRRPSGVAVLDPDGVVVAEGWATADEEIIGFLAEHDQGGAVVALDAPLVVGNRRGPGGGVRGSSSGGTGGCGLGRIRRIWGCSGGGCGRWSWSGGRGGRT